MSVFAAWYSSVILVTGAVPPSPEAVALAEKKKCSALFMLLKAMVKIGGLVGCLELDSAFLSCHVNWETHVS